MHDDHPGSDKPSNAGLYDAAQGGGDHYGPERAAVRAFTQKWGPGLAGNAIGNRAFLGRAVETVAESGIRQFLDLGCGPAAAENVHDIAQVHHPDVRVVYVDNDPTVLAHWQAITPGNQNITYLEADIRDAEKILSHPDTERLIDWSEPVAVLAVTTPHYLADGDDPAGVLGRYVRDAAPGSHLAISHISSDGADPGLIADLEALYVGGMHARDIAAIRRMFQGWELLEPGELVDVRDWRNGGQERSPLPLLCGVAVKPERR